LSVLVFFVSSGTAMAQVEVWTRQFGSMAAPDLNNGFGSEKAESLATDQQGNIYVTGRTSGFFPGQTSAGNDDVYLRKFDPAGNEVWTRQIGTGFYETSSRVSLDTFGNAYVAANRGFSSFDLGATLHKYGPSGIGQWSAPLGAVEVACIASDADGNTYLGVNSPGSSGVPSWSLRKYDASGLLVWTRQLGSSLAAASIAVDVTGTNLYIAGNIKSFTGVQTIYLRQYTSDGTQVQHFQFGNLTLINHVESIAVNGANVHLAGWTANVDSFGVPLPGSADALLAKYDSLGNTVQTAQFGTSSDDFIRSIAVDSSGFLHVAGETRGVFPGQVGSSDGDIFVRKLGFNGEILWTHQFGSPDRDSGGVVVIDRTNSILVGGGTNGTLPGQSRPILDTERNADAFVRKYGTPAAGVDRTMALIPSLGLNDGNEIALIRMLSNIKESLGFATATTAINQLNAFKHLVSALETSNRLSQASADSLRGAADELLNVLLAN
jgi:hypothetical protein